MGYERCGRCGFKLSEHGSPGFQTNTRDG
jgi:hypothetical protein